MVPYAILLNTANLYDIECRGDFRAAENRMRSCLDTRLKHLPPDDESICGGYCNLGNAVASQHRFEEALTWFKKADSLALKHKEWPMKQLLVDLNISRVYYHIGEYTNSARRLDAALEEASRWNSMFWAVRSVKICPTWNSSEPN
jgi:tetratricopeptide (TPR) repeat protein